MNAVINLKKNDTLNLKKGGKPLNKILVGLGWQTTADIDLDVSAFICKTANGKPLCISNNHFVFFNNLCDPERGVVHSGDNRTGNTRVDDDEMITIDFNKVHPHCNEISIVVTIYDSEANNKTLNLVHSAYLKIYDLESDSDLVAEYNLKDLFYKETSVQIGSFFKDNSGNWSFKSIGAGYNLHLADLVNGYFN